MDSTLAIPALEEPLVSDMVRPLDVQDGMKMAELNLIKFPDMFWYTVYVSVE